MLSRDLEDTVRTSANSRLPSATTVDDTPRSKLVPVRNLPWMVSTSVSGIMVCHLENEHVVASFDACVLGDDPRDALEYSRVRVHFEHGLWVQVQPSFSGRETLPPNMFDESALYPMLDRRAFREKWIATGLCPEPRVFEVEESEWLETCAPVRDDFRHYLVVGCDCWFQVLASGYYWEFDKGPLAPAVPL